MSHCVIFLTNNNTLQTTSFTADDVAGAMTSDPPTAIISPVSSFDGKVHHVRVEHIVEAYQAD